jgi:predicted Rossmann fold flavoprotein
VACPQILCTQILLSEKIAYRTSRSIKSKPMKTRNIVVVGGGPAGMMAAIRAGQLRQRVILLEKNPMLGKKLLLTGKGRCNLTNMCDLADFLEHFSMNGEFLRDAFKIFFNQDLVDFFEKRGLKLKTERQLRVFPESDSSQSIMEVLKKELQENNVKIIYNSAVDKILIKDKEVEKIVFKDGSFLECDAVILATGGISYASTGSTGDGFEIAEELGHRLKELKPGLVPLVTKERYPKLLEGLTLKNIRIVFSDGKKKITSEVGELLFTDFGISGPLVLTLSGRVVDMFRQDKDIYADIDLKPALTKEKIEARILREIKFGPKKTIKNMLKDFLPLRMIGVFLDITKITPDKIVSYLTQEEREKLASLFKAMRLNISGPRPMNLAMITRGGISLKDVDPRTMASRLVKGLYFAGEILDIDADTGGFNLQAAFSTGYLAGESSAK